MKRTFILFLSTFSLLISGCNLDITESENSDKSGAIITVTQAQIVIDSESHYEVFEGEVGEHKPPINQYLDKISYEINDSISNQGGYQVTGEGPFFTITNRRFLNNNLTNSSTSYINILGELEFSINDTTYANQYDVTFSSERDSTLSTYQIGESYITKGSQRRFDNNRYNLQYILKSETIYTPRKLEELSVASGTYSTLKIDFVQTTDVNKIYSADVKIIASGSQWLDTATGKLIKEYTNSTLYDAASFGTEYEKSIKFYSEKTHLLDKASQGKVIETQSAKFSGHIMPKNINMQ